MKHLNLFGLFIIASAVRFSEIQVKRVSLDLMKDYHQQELWNKAADEVPVTMMAQPVVAPRPKTTQTSEIRASALHDGKSLVFRLRWKDAEMSNSGKLGTYSDGVAMQFPVLNPDQPPAIMMGHKGSPVHIFHWKLQYQSDLAEGRPGIKEIYPNMTVDMYPQDFKVKGNFTEATDQDKNAFVGGIAAKNPQSMPRSSAVDELIAEGFGTTTTLPEVHAKGMGFWQGGEWTVYLIRPIKYESLSSLSAGGKSHVAFAVWQGSKDEIGGTKSLTMAWTPIVLEE